ncbi:hypothetical protein BEWA_023940 [Theileria equi strain WA]|uniref:Oxidation resistance protein 1 n=1 Tax=Theileria equi strain WA TaxID=1537102 RepID=L0AVH2_THEEQ|nr:hypothetical protein BEWA_023940 [Theileria equi strain WA]AFZ79545.1 hypothetical protein BEWA_023940 [Theileria equi strain WA]|eukprot:XP_004829211.1 hypothetical protein BEWA_023940 [Theileria equi strain WA]
MSLFRQGTLIRPGAIKEAVLSAYRPEPKESEPEDPFGDIFSFNLPKHRDILFRETCQYCILPSPILGILTLTRESLTFEPDVRDFNVHEKGPGYYQVHIDVENILECGCIGGPSQELVGAEDIRCNGFLQIVVKPTTDSTASDLSSIDSSAFGGFDISARSDTPGSQERNQRPRSFLSSGWSRLGSVVTSVITFNLLKSRSSGSGVPRTTTTSARESMHTSVLFGYYKKDVAYKCTSLLMDLLDSYRNETIVTNRSGITRIPFSSNRLIESWNVSNKKAKATDVKLVSDVLADSSYYETIAKNSNILTSYMLERLTERLPPSIAIREWVLSFKTDHDGISFNTFYKNLEDKENCLLLIQDTGGAVFGAFTGPIHYNVRFYGSGETFVFKFLQNELKVYTSQGNNRCFVFTNDDSIIIGGGRNPAISVGKDFLFGTSAASETFNNEQLSTTPSFAIRFMEVWTFGTFVT